MDDRVQIFVLSFTASLALQQAAASEVEQLGLEQMLQCGCWQCCIYVIKDICIAECSVRASLKISSDLSIPCPSLNPWLWLYYGIYTNLYSNILNIYIHKHPQYLYDWKQITWPFCISIFFIELKNKPTHFVKIWQVFAEYLVRRLRLGFECEQMCDLTVPLAWKNSPCQFLLLLIWGDKACTRYCWDDCT